MKPVKILMGLHPHAGWRSFKTSEEVSTLWFGDEPLTVYENGRTSHESVMTPFGFRLARRLTAAGMGAVLVDRIRYGTRQFELYLEQGGPTWEELLPSILHYIALEHSDTGQYVLEVCDMSGGEQRWDIDPDAEELEEIDEHSDSFTVN
jgi:hypothetical protein